MRYEDFKRKDGYWIIEANGKEYYMRSHPLNMLSSMINKGHDRFIVEKSPQPISIADSSSVMPEEVACDTLTIDDLKAYINHVKLIKGSK